MSDYLKGDEYIPFAPAWVGTINKHHCKQGRENDKLFITRCEDGHTILAYCHHCGMKGKHDERGDMTVAQMENFKAVTRKANGKYTLPKNSSAIIHSNTPPQASMWVNTAGVMFCEAEAHGIRWSPFYQRVFIPVMTFGQLSMLQTRRVFNDDGGPKYCNYKNFDGLPFRSYNPARPPTALTPKAVVIVEDALSCIRVGRHFPCIALMGTHLTDVMLAYLLSKEFTQFIVFLDDDNYEVKCRQQDLHNRLCMFNPTTVLHNGGVDPKEMDDAALEDVLKAAVSRA